jgi:HAD superfamily hydrolase (TIGR01458 family)
MVKGVLLDLAGVVYQGDQLLPGAGEAIARLRSAGVPLRFLTNTTRTPKRRIIERLTAMGLAISDDELFTPAQAARDWVSVRQLTPFLVVYPDLVGELAELSGAEGEAVVVGDAGETLSYNLLNDAFRRLIDGAAFLALARNRSFRDRDGELSLDAGPFVAALEYATRREATVLGKPSPDFFAVALSSMDCAAKDAVMVGDDAEADVAGALAAGIGAALLVRTGKYRPGDEKHVSPAPTATVANLSEAVAWIVNQGAQGAT